MSAIPTNIPHGQTARRLEWPHLPPRVRAEVERRCGSEVVAAASQTSGFTPGFASVLTCADGSRHFVKAASTKAQRMFAVSYLEEARKLAALPEGVPAPRLRWLLDERTPIERFSQALLLGGSALFLLLGIGAAVLQRRGLAAKLTAGESVG